MQTFYRNTGPTIFSLCAERRGSAKTSLAKVSAALRVGVEELLSRPRSNCQLVLAGEIPIEKRSHGRALLHKLLPDRVKGLEIDRVELDGEVLMSGPPHLQGTKEYLSTISGEITVYVAGQTFVVRKDDVLAFPADQPHSYRNQKRGIDKLKYGEHRR